MRECHLGRPFSANERYAVSSSGRLYKTAKYKRWIALNKPLIQEQMKPPERFPVEVHITVMGGRGWSIKDRKDADNVIKPIVDLLVRAGVLPDDSLRYVSHAQAKFLPSLGTKSEPLTVVRYEEPEDESQSSEWDCAIWRTAQAQVKTSQATRT